MAAKKIAERARASTSGSFGMDIAINDNGL
jgi:hypothetical protein